MLVFIVRLEHGDYHNNSNCKTHQQECLLPRRCLLQGHPSTGRFTARESSKFQVNILFKSSILGPWVPLQTVSSAYCFLFPILQVVASLFSQPEINREQTAQSAKGPTSINKFYQTSVMRGEYHSKRLS